VYLKEPGALDEDGENARGQPMGRQLLILELVVD